MKQFRLLLLLVLLMTAATGAWGMQIYISYPSWPTDTNVNGDGNLVLEMEASDSFENMKAKIEDKSGLNPDYMHLFFNDAECADNETLYQKGVTSNSVLTLVYTPYNVTMKSGTQDADKWTVKVGEGQAQALPLEGVAEGTKVTLQYNGTKHVKSVTAVTKAAAPAGNPAPTTAAIDAYTGGAFAWDGDGSTATVDVTINTFAANDGISILSAKNTNTKFTTSAGGASATFSGTATDDSKFYAVYPYTAGLTLSGDVITGVVIPSDQWNDKWGNYTEDESSWDPKAPIAYATTTGSSLQFHNLCAILIINPYWGGDGWITISADQNLAGTFSLDTSTGTLTATAGSKTVTIGSSSGLSKRVMGMGEYMYIAIAPGSYTNFKVRTDEVYGGAEKTKASVTFEAGKIYDLGKVRPY